MGDRLVSSNELLAAQCGETVVVRVGIRGDYQNAPALKRFCDQSREQGAKQLILDGKISEGMDSTFLGTLVGLAADFRAVGGRVYVTRLSGNLRKAFQTLGIDRVLAIHAQGELPDGVLQSTDTASMNVLGATADLRVLNEAMTVAHENLSLISERNRQEFKDVLMYLRQDVTEGQD